MILTNQDPSEVCWTIQATVRGDPSWYWLFTTNPRIVLSDSELKRACRVYETKEEAVKALLNHSVSNRIMHIRFCMLYKPLPERVLIANVDPFYLFTNHSYAIESEMSYQQFKVIYKDIIDSFNGQNLPL